MSDTVGFHWSDYLVFATTLLIALLIGLYHGLYKGGQKSTEAYLSGGRKMTVAPVATSMFMSGISAIIILGNAAEIYYHGTQTTIDAIFRCFATAISAVLFVSMHHKLKTFNVFEFHRRRYESKLLQYACVIGSMAYAILYAGLAIYTPSTAMEAVTGFPAWASILLLGLLSMVYTTLGGIKAVVYTDFFQGFVMYGGLLIVIILGFIEVGGVVHVFEVSQKRGRFSYFNMDPDPTQRSSFWSAAAMGFFSFVAASGSDQGQVQRYCSLPTVKQAMIAVLSLIPMIITIYAITTLCGLIIFTYYDDLGCDPLLSGSISNPNQLMPYFLVDAIKVPGVAGIFVAALYAGALSSISTSLNGLSAMTWGSFLADKEIFRKLRESRKALVTKIITFIFGCISIGVGFLMGQLKAHVMQIASAILGGLGAPLGAAVFAGAVFPWVQWKGMLVGFFSGIFMIGWINIGHLLYDPHPSFLDVHLHNCSFPNGTIFPPMPKNPDDIFGLYKLSYQYISTVGFITSVIVALIVSLLTGKQDPSQVDPMTITPVVDNFCHCCISEKLSDTCHCGVMYRSQQSEEKCVSTVPDIDGMERSFVKEQESKENGTAESTNHIANGTAKPTFISSDGFTNFGYCDGENEITSL